MSEDLSNVTLGELIAHVGGVVHSDETVRFGSPMAVQAMLDKLAGHFQAQVHAYAEDCRNAVDIAKAHIAEVNYELALLRVAYAQAVQSCGSPVLTPDAGAHATPGVH